MVNAGMITKSLADAPLYRCHKVVKAQQITAVVKSTYSLTVRFGDEFAPLHVNTTETTTFPTRRKKPSRRAMCWTKFQSNLRNLRPNQ